jgi:hypothetical protein
MIFMKKFAGTLTALMVAAAMFCGTAAAHPDSAVSESKTKVQLTDAQKQELAAIHGNIMEQKRALFTKYVEFGIISEAKAKEILTHIEEKHAKLEKNGYIPNWDKKKKERR